MDEKLGHRTHTRDPKVWKYKDRYTLILGSKFIESGSISLLEKFYFTLVRTAKTGVIKIGIMIKK